MVSTQKDPVLAVLSLSGGNDFMNSVIPYTNPLYRDHRPNLAIPEDQVLPINDELAFHPAMAPLKKFWDAGEMAIILGVGYPNPNRSHFRSMDIWHTCEPDKLGTEGWLGRAIQDLDPQSENVLTGVNFGRGLPRALAKDGVPVASVGDLDTYGLLTGIEGEDQRSQALEVFQRIYSPTIGRSAVLEYMHRTGIDALKGADILSTAPGKYSSEVEYPRSDVGQYMKAMAQVHLANFGTRILYTTSPYNSFDTHANQGRLFAGLWQDVSNTVETFFDDLREHQASEEVVLLLFSEFGRRANDNGTGSDHGTGGVSFVIGEKVKGGIYSEYPPWRRTSWRRATCSTMWTSRSVYSTLAESWLGLDPVPIVGGNFEPVDFL